MTNAPLCIAVVIEDDPDVREILEAILVEAGFDVRVAANGTDGVALVLSANPVLTTLDVNMPGMDGFETLKRIRALSSTRIVIISARSDEIDVVLGLSAGADEFIHKPFRTREVRARIEAVLRRSADFGCGGRAPGTAAPRTATPVNTPTLRSTTATTDAAGVRWLDRGGLRLDQGQRQVEIDGLAVALTRSEFDLLAALATAGRRVCTKAELVLLLRNEPYVTSGYVTKADQRALEVHVANLRKKLGRGAFLADRIETVRGIGYRLR